MKDTKSATQIVAVMTIALAAGMILTPLANCAGRASAQPGSGSAVYDAAPAVTPDSAPATPPNASLDDVVEHPSEAIDDLKQAKKTSWPLFLLALLIIAQRSLAKAAEKWDVKPIDWIDSHLGKWLVILGTVASASFDVVALGGAWISAAYAAAGALLYALVPPGAKKTETAKS